MKIRNVTEERKVFIGKTARTILSIVGAAGIISVALIAPNIFGALGKLSRPAQKRYVVNMTIKKLVKAGYVKISLKNGKENIEFTEKGRFLAAKIGESRVVAKKEAWDGKWRVIIFDIPEKRSNIRRQLRMTLGNLGFVRLQDSVWIYPYKCEALISMIRFDLKIENETLYMTVERFDNDAYLRECFRI